MTAQDLSAAYARHDVVFVTPSWRGDFERFQLLRASLGAAGLGGVPHYAVVQTEDLPLFRQGAPEVRYLSTAEVLPEEVEVRRVRFIRTTPNRRMQLFKRSLYKRLGWFPDANFYGWHTQQLVKLGLGRHLPHAVLVSIDSDVIVTRPVPADEFVRGDDVALFEQRETLQRPLRRPGWYGQACRLLDRPWPHRAGEDTFNYVTHPFAFRAQVLRELLDWLEQRYQRPWWQTMLSQPLGGWSEFMTYGAFVRLHQDSRGTFTAVANQACRWLETPEQRANAAQVIRAIFDDPEVYYLVIQADHHLRFTLRDYEPLVCAELARRSA